MSATEAQSPGNSPATGATAAGPDLATALTDAWTRLQRREYAAAHTAASALRARHPDHRDVLYLLAVSARYLERFDAALAVLAELHARHPTFGRAFEERGLCELARGATAEAIAAFRKAVALNSWLPLSWQALERLYAQCNQPQDAAAAARSLANLQRLPREIVTAYGLCRDGDLRPAEDLVRLYLRTHGDHIEGLRLLARIAMAHEVFDEAELLLEKALAMAPEHHAMRYEYAIVLLRRLRHLRAREELEKLLSIDPKNRDYRRTHAAACDRLGDNAQALRAYEQLLRETPDDVELQLAAGYELKTLGRTEDAIECFRAAAAHRGNGRAYWSLANLKTYRFEQAELDTMVASEAAADTTAEERCHLCFALGKALEDRGDYARSFQYYARGNALKRAQSRYDPQFLETLARQQIATCTREFFSARAGWGYADASPIFIVGLPRVGSTLLEQILGSHSQVDGTMELPEIAHLVFDLHDRTRPPDNPRYPAVLAELSAEDCARRGEQYIRNTHVYRHGKPYFIDKWPSNFRDLGFIHLILPNARVIDVRRGALACCFSNFKQLFPAHAGPEFAYSFEDLARYYRMYLDLMRHWDSVLAGKILHVQYEALITDFPQSVARILEFCGLAPESGCFDFYKTERAVHSPSSEQVRRPINREGLEQWRHFEPWLGPLQEALKRLGVPPA